MRSPGIFLLAACALQGTFTVLGRELLQSVPAPSPAVVDEYLSELTATEAVALLCSRNVTAVDYVQALLERYITSGYACINPWISLNTTQVLLDAAAIDAKYERGESILPLCGLPLTVKDSINVKGYRTTNATPSLANFYPNSTAPLVTAYLAANGIVLGKSNLAEIQGTITSFNPTLNGITTPLNPYSPTHTSGGSSGGSAALLATRLTPLALCEDTGGSCRSPAIANGVFGLRPTLGCYNATDSVVPALPDRDTVGSMGRTVEDLILLDSIVRNSNATTTMSGAVPNKLSCAVNVDRNLSLKGVRLGLPSTFGWGQGLSAEVTTLASATLNKLEAAGAILVPFNSSGLNNITNLAFGGFPGGPSTFSGPDAINRFLFRNQINLTFAQYVKQIVRPDTRKGQVAKITATGPLTDVANWWSYLQNGRPETIKYWQDTFTNNSISAMLYPLFSTSIPAVDAGDQFVPFTNSSGTVIIPFSPTTFSSIDAGAVMTVGAFPLGMDANNLPWGMQFAAPPGSDGLVLSLMLAMEKLTGPMPPPPTIAACSGCTANVTISNVTFNGTGQPGANDVWTNFGLTFNNQCLDSTLTNYGRSGLKGKGSAVSSPTPQPSLTVPAVAPALPTFGTAG